MEHVRVCKHKTQLSPRSFQFDCWNNSLHPLFCHPLRSLPKPSPQLPNANQSMPPSTAEFQFKRLSNLNVVQLQLSLLAFLAGNMHGIGKHLKPDLKQTSQNRHWHFYLHPRHPPPQKHHPRPSANIDTPWRIHGTGIFTTVFTYMNAWCLYSYYTWILWDGCQVAKDSGCWKMKKTWNSLDFAV